MSGYASGVIAKDFMSTVLHLMLTQCFEQLDSFSRELDYLEKSIKYFQLFLLIYTHNKKYKKHSEKY